MGKIAGILLVATLCLSCKLSVGQEQNATAEVQGVKVEVQDSVIVNSYTLYEQELLALGFVDIKKLDSTIKVDLRYASANNFMDTVIYDSLQHALMHKETAKKLVIAHQELKNINPDLRLIVFDALRPRAVQYKLYEQVKGTPKQKYVASPGAGSMHNFGCAVDVSIVDTEGKLVDMGTIFDHFGPAAEYRNNYALLKKGELTEEQVANRKLLRNVMRKAVFVPIDSEWWHFNSFNRDYVRASFKVVD